MQLYLRKKKKKTFPIKNDFPCRSDNKSELQESLQPPSKLNIVLEPYGLKSTIQNMILPLVEMPSMVL